MVKINDMIVSVFVVFLCFGCLKFGIVLLIVFILVSEDELEEKVCKNSIRVIF